MAANSSCWLCPGTVPPNCDDCMQTLALYDCSIGSDDNAAIVAKTATHIPVAITVSLKALNEALRGAGRQGPEVNDGKQDHWQRAS